MNKPFFLLIRLFLVVCVTLYGQLGMGHAGSQNATSYVEICANGVVKTVPVDADGVPVEPANDCNNCLTCCQSTELQANVSSPSELIFLPLETTVDRVRIQCLRLQKRNIRPMLRGPPVVLATLLTKPLLTETDQDITGLVMRSDGHPSLKDAAA
ncbi:hypothetical protein BCF46_1852 [Litoreibacter meonggei]|uniref:Uncharacterized protein n=1 Tax=Litoreibacter meonggei TaxID=1049199 RepID=A0A497WEU3_9RHOB|nr:hypothetical protein [Litoreibacter meonggei]RLJ51638.1 hypothetical protein BCF46_1852 [Litoreibacter meonggei]